MLMRHDFQKLRVKLEGEIERLIALLDNIAGDEEDDDDTGAEDHPEGFDPESDHGGEELGELDEAEHGLCLEYGLDQSIPVSRADLN